MTLKKLNRFTVFDWKKFFAGKELMLSKVELWQEGEDRDHLKTLGTKITGVVFKDKTDYGTDGTGVNAGESIVFKVSQPVSTFESWKPFRTLFRVTSVTKASIYGDFRNQLSVKVPTLDRVVSQSKK